MQAARARRLFADYFTIIGVVEMVKYRSSNKSRSLMGATSRRALLRRRRVDGDLLSAHGDSLFDLIQDSLASASSMKARH